MKKLLLTTAALVAAPLSAQQPATPVETAPAPAAASTSIAPPPAAVPAQPVEAAPAQPVAPVPVTAQPAIATGAGTIARTPAAGSTEVAGIIAREFPAYDKNADGALDTAEFGDWMLKLKSIADPTSTVNAEANKTWVNAAFAQADADKSHSLTLGELTGFLSQG